MKKRASRPSPRTGQGKSRAEQSRAVFPIIKDTLKATKIGKQAKHNRLATRLTKKIRQIVKQGPSRLRTTASVSINSWFDTLTRNISRKVVTL